MLQDESAHLDRARYVLEHRVEFEDVAMGQVALVAQTLLRQALGAAGSNGGVHNGGHAADDYYEYGKRGQHARAVTHGELAQAIAGTVRVGQHRLVAQVAFHIPRKRGHGGVAALRFLSQPLQQDGFKVSAQMRIKQARRSRRRLTQDTDRFQQSRSLQRIRQRARQDAVQQRRQRKNVAGHAQLAALGLFGTGIAWGQQAQCGLGLRCAAIDLRQDTCDPEVQQACFTRPGDENVGGLQVQMQNKLLMRGLYRRRYLQEEVELCPNAQVMASAILIDRNSIDVLQHQIGPSVRSHSAVQQSRDAAVCQPSQDLTLFTKPFFQCGREDALLNDLHRDLLLVNAVCALRQIDGTHAAAAKLAQQTVIPYSLFCWRHGLCSFVTPCIHGKDTAGVQLRAKQALCFCADLSISHMIAEVGVALCGGHQERRLDGRANLGPAFWRHAVYGAPLRAMDVRRGTSTLCGTIA